jgi:broad specificity phosphatase PhoE
MFYTNLTPEGHKNADNLKHILSKLKIDQIFSSPFPRTIQTIIPYCIQNNLHNKINVDYSLYETMFDPCFTKDNYQVTLTANDNEFKYTNTNYDSMIKINDINCPETTDDVQKRITKFIDMLIDLYTSINSCILIVSHGSVLTPLVPKSETLYPLGGVTKIYDNGTVYEPINY